MKAKQQGLSSKSQPRKRSLFDRLKSRFTTTFSSSKSQERRGGAPAGDPPAVAHATDANSAEIAFVNYGIVQTATLGA